MPYTCISTLITHAALTRQQRERIYIYAKLQQYELVNAETGSITHRPTLTLPQLTLTLYNDVLKCRLLALISF